MVIRRPPPPTLFLDITTGSYLFFLLLSDTFSTWNKGERHILSQKHYSQWTQTIDLQPCGLRLYQPNDMGRQVCRCNSTDIIQTRPAIWQCRSSAPFFLQSASHKWQSRYKELHSRTIKWLAENYYKGKKLYKRTQFCDTHHSGSSSFGYEWHTDTHSLNMFFIRKVQ